MAVRDRVRQKIVIHRSTTKKMQLLSLSLAVLCGATFVAPSERGRDTGFFAVWSDVHYYANYTAGSPATCPAQAASRGCCGAHDWSVPPHRKAGEYGDYNCDSPDSLVNLTLDALARRHAEVGLDFVLLLGDSADHRLLEQSVGSNLDSVRHVVRRYASRFPTTTGSSQAPRLFSVHGNHDTWPCDQLCPPEGAAGLYREVLGAVADAWEPWIGKEAAATVRHGGYYTALLPTGYVARSPVRLLSLETLWYSQLNVANLMQGCGTAGDQQQWDYVGHVLQAARRGGERVWLVGHQFPGGSGMSQQWTDWVQQLFVDYADVLAESFWGHSHTDRLLLFRGGAGGVGPAVGHGYVGPSVVPDEHFPAHRVYAYNRTTGRVLDYWQYGLNLTAATAAAGPPDFKLLYRATEAYGLRDLSTRSWAEWADVQLPTNPAALARYWANYHPGVDHGPCELKSRCARELFCDAQFANPDARNACLEDVGPPPWNVLDGRA